MEVEAFLIVVPAHNEADLITPTLEALSQAMDHVPLTASLALIVADRCTDHTADLVREFRDPRIALLEGSFHSAGSARKAGILRGLELLKEKQQPLDRIWIANTDADSRVPLHWLACQAHFAQQGFDVVLGTVEPRGISPEESVPDALIHQLIHQWHDRHQLIENHRHIFGANLGLSAIAYQKAGGFATVDVGEDSLLIERLRDQKAIIRSTDRNRVVTSGRLRSNVQGGFASFLASLPHSAEGVKNQSAYSELLSP